jgi:uncharacterized protein (DUF1501 family)
MSFDRRRFLHTAGALTAGGLFPALALRATRASAQSAGYRALVCIFLYGGNDSNNTIVPYDDYATYAQGRAGTGADLGKGQLLQIAPPGLPRYGLHPNLSALLPLFGQGKLAVIANVGTLLAPISRADYMNGKSRPRNLFSHSDQQLVWQGQIPGAPTPSGWGGRVADVVPSGNPALAIPGMVSLSGDALFTVGVTTLPVSLAGDGSLGLAGDRGSDEGQVRYDAMARILTVDRESQLVAKAQDVMTLAIKSSDALSAALDSSNAAIDSAFAGTNGGLADQLYQIAKLVAARDSLGVARQGFFASAGGYDTHNEQGGAQASLFDELGSGLAAFQKAMDALGCANDVTTFTLSDFSRTFRVNANAGTDHAWGGHHFVLGGSVKGGALYGRYPNLAMGGPDDAGDDGQWIPSTSIDQYGATLARWFGVSTSDLVQVFPNLAAFAQADLGFLR